MNNDAVRNMNTKIYNANQRIDIAINNIDNLSNLVLQQGEEITQLKKDKTTDRHRMTRMEKTIEELRRLLDNSVLGVLSNEDMLELDALEDEGIEEVLDEIRDRTLTEGS